MRVLVLSSVFPNSRQPTLGVFVQERVRRVARACEVRVVAPVPWFPGNRLIRGPRWSGIAELEFQDGFHVYHPRVLSIPRYGKALDGFFYGASLLPFFLRLRRQFPFDLIDAHFVYPDGVGAMLLGKWFRLPVSITLRGTVVRHVTHALHRVQIRWALQHAHRIMAVSQSLKNLAVGLGIAPDRIRVVPNGVDNERFGPLDQADARRACGLPLDRTILLTVGGVYAGKGQHLVVEALRDLIQQWPNLLYVIVGNGMPGDRYVQSLEQIIVAYGLTKHVRFVGGRPHDELRQWYGAADLFCLATRSEGRANVLLESIACGLPVVTTEVGGNPEVVRPGVDGFMVSFGDVPALTAAIREALTREWDREAMVSYAKSFSWDESALAVLEELGALSLSTSQRIAVARP